MNNYRLILMIDGHHHDQSFGTGDSAIEAFETAFKDGIIQLPDDVPVKVLATDTKSKLTIEFKVYHNG